MKVLPLVIQTFYLLVDLIHLKGGVTKGLFRLFNSRFLPIQPLKPLFVVKTGKFNKMMLLKRRPLPCTTNKTNHLLRQITRVQARFDRKIQRFGQPANRVCNVD